MAAAAARTAPGSRTSFTPPALPRPPAVHLRLHHPDRATDAARGGFRFIGRGGHEPFRDRDPVAGENFLRLVFVRFIV